MPTVRASFGSLPNETLDEIARFVATSSPSELREREFPISPTREIVKPYPDLCRLRLVDRRCRHAATPVLFRSVVLPLSDWGPRVPQQARALASLVDVNPTLLHSVEMVAVDYPDSSSSMFKWALENPALAVWSVVEPAIRLMPNLRVAIFGCPVSAAAIVSALHPDAKIEVVRQLEAQDELLIIDGPRHERLRALGLYLDIQSPEPGLSPTATLQLPPSLISLALSFGEAHPSSVLLASSSELLQTVEIYGGRLPVESLEAFFVAQGPFITSLKLSCRVIGSIASWIKLCINLSTLTVCDLDLPTVVSIDLPSLSTINLVLPVLNQGNVFRPMYEDTFDRVSVALTDSVKHGWSPQLRTVQYANGASTRPYSTESQWSSIFRDQTYPNDGPASLQKALDAGEIKLLDSKGAPWDEAVWRKSQLSVADLKRLEGGFIYGVDGEREVIEEDGSVSPYSRGDL